MSPAAAPEVSAEVLGSCERGRKRTLLLRTRTEVAAYSRFAWKAIARGTGPSMARVRWTKAWMEDETTLAVEFWDSPDVVPHEAVLDEQPDYIGLMLTVTPRPKEPRPGVTEWTRQVSERHVAEIRLPFASGDRTMRDVKPRRPPGVTVSAIHLVDPDDDPTT